MSVHGERGPLTAAATGWNRFLISPYSFALGRAVAFRRHVAAADSLDLNGF